ncbi:MAG: hypothetical protein LBV12_09070, partial [Puniceicoccales bacterium]|nr:hypothetical protein [Puniceicoccales bacterium]
VQVESHADDTDVRLQSLRACLSLLSPAEMALLRIKYLARGELTAYALKSKQSPNKLHKTLSRIRLRLRSCILKRLNASK